MGHAIVILGIGPAPSGYAIQQMIDQLVTSMGADIEDRSKIRVEVVDTRTIAHKIVASLITPEVSVDTNGVLPADHAIAVIGGIFEEQLKYAKEHPALFTSFLVRRYDKSDVGNDVDRALINAIEILKDPHVEYSQSVAKKWGFTKTIHKAIVDLYPILTR